MKNKSRNGKSLASPLAWLAFVVTFVLGLLAEWLLPFRVFVGIIMLAFIFSLVVLILSFVKSRKSRSELPSAIWIGVCTISAFFITAKGFAYAFIDVAFLPFWEIGLILGLFTGCFVMIKWCWKGSRWFGRIGGILGITLVTAILVIVFASHLNFLLDFHEPVACAARIEEKEVDRHRKSPDTYSFEVTVDGETFDLVVGLIEYEQYEVGDIYTFEKYRGAFGKSFYISD